MYSTARGISLWRRQHLAFSRLWIPCSWTPRRATESTSAVSALFKTQPFRIPIDKQGRPLRILQRESADTDTMELDAQRAPTYPLILDDNNLFESYMEEFSITKDSEEDASRPQSQSICTGLEDGPQLDPQKQESLLPAIVSLHKSQITQDCYVDLSNRVRPCVRIRWLENPYEARFIRGDEEIRYSLQPTVTTWHSRSFEIAYFRKEPFPPNTGGFLYLHIPKQGTPLLSAALRFRVTNNPDPESFDASTSYDLSLFCDPLPLGRTHGDGMEVELADEAKYKKGLTEATKPSERIGPYAAWSLPLINPQAKKFMPLVRKAFRYVSDSGLSPNLLHSFEYFQNKRLPTTPQVVYAFKQPFLIDFNSLGIRLRAVGRKDRHSTIFSPFHLQIALPNLRIWSESEAKRTIHKVPLFAGTAIACLERVALREDLDLKQPPPFTADDGMHESIVFIRILELVTPIRFNPAIPKAMIQRDKVPWIAKGQPMPSASASHRYIRQDPALNRHENRYALQNVWHWNLPAEERLWPETDVKPRHWSQRGALEADELEASRQQYLHELTMGLRALKHAPEKTWDF